MRRYYIYEKSKKTILVDSMYCTYSYFMLKEMPWEYLGYIDGAKDLYDFFRQCTEGFRQEYIFTDSFLCELDRNTYAAYLIRDDRDKIRDFWEIAKSFEEKRERIWSHFCPDDYLFRSSPVPGIHKPSHWSDQPASAQMRERRDTLSQKDINTLRAEYPDASIHVRRAKRKKDWPDLWDDDFWPVPQENKSWKYYKNRYRQWDKGNSSSGIYVQKYDNLHHINETDDCEERNYV